MRIFNAEFTQTALNKINCNTLLKTSGDTEAYCWRIEGVHAGDTPRFVCQIILAVPTTGVFFTILSPT